jgi:DNA modification methylase
MTVRIMVGDCLARLRELPDESVHCCVTSPPYWALRNYEHPDQVGLEGTPAEYVAKLVEVFAEVRRCLVPEGTLWLNLGDSYNGTGGAGGDYGPGGMREGQPKYRGKNAPGLKPKDLVGIPWRVAFGLQDDGWWLRQEIIWNKPNPMPESAKDRPTRAHEQIFLLTKSKDYHYDQEAGSEDSLTGDNRKPYGSQGSYAAVGRDSEELGAGRPRKGGDATRRNLRSVWTVTPRGIKGAHFAVFPPDLIRPCVAIGCPEGGTVLDPFFGSGTTGIVADRLKRNCVGFELNPDYAVLAEARVRADAGLFADVHVDQLCTCGAADR